MTKTDPWVDRAMRRIRTTASRGLRLRDAPLDGTTLDVLPAGTELEVFDEERWLKVRSPDGTTGFVSAEYVEPVTDHERTAESWVTTFTHQRIRSEQLVRIHRDFTEAMDTVVSAAEETDVIVFVTSALRRPNQSVSGAVVEPATMSNHHVGHAIDFNLIYEGQWLNSGRLLNWSGLPEAAQAFIERLRVNGLRWGGDFSKKDPVHIDDDLNHRNPEGYKVKLAAIWS